MRANCDVRGAALMVAVLGWIAQPASARAQAPEASGAAQAASVFEEARHAFEQKQYDVACPGFLRSYELDRTKVGVLYALAECYAEAGKVASAVTRYKAYVQAVDALPPNVQGKHLERVERAKAQQAALAAGVPEVKLVVSGAGAPGARVVLDGGELQEASLNAPLSLDPGEHRVTVTSREGVNIERVFTLKPTDKKSVELEIGAKVPAGPSQVQASSHADAEKRNPDATQSAGISGQRIGAIAALGVGAAGLVVMGITGGIVLGNGSAVREACPAVLADGRGECNTRADAEHANSMFSLSVVSTVSLGVGLAGVALGTALFVTEPEKPERASAPRLIALGPMSLGAEGAVLGAAGVW